MKNIQRIYNSIVRIKSQIAQYNWIQPYKSINDMQSIGTGFFINKEGYLLTCAHVVADSIKVYITLPSKSKDIYEAEIISYYPEIDLALLKVSNLNIEDYLELGDSDKIIPGESVNAVGFPLGLEKLKFTKGIVSGRHNDNIQTDTPLNPGNSGGPLINNNYEVIGINSSGISPEESENVGYAIPINLFKTVEKIMLDKKNIIIYKPSLGIIYQNINSELKKYYNIECEGGVLIKQIAKQSSLYKKIDINDILCKIDNNIIDNYGECVVKWDNEKIPINNILPRYNVGDIIKLHIWRSQKSKMEIISHKLQSSKEVFKLIQKYPYFEDIEYLVLGGIVVMELTLNHIIFLKEPLPMLGKYEQIEYRNKSRLIITSIYPGSNISELNVLTPGDILMKVNNKEVNTISEYKNSIIDSIKKKKEQILIETEKNIAIISLNKLKKEEKFLSENFHYPISDIVDLID